MEMIKITLPDGAVREYPKGSTGTQIAAGISEGLARVAIAIEVNGQTQELYRTVETDASFLLGLSGFMGSREESVCFREVTKCV